MHYTEIMVGYSPKVNHLKFTPNGLVQVLSPRHLVFFSSFHLYYLETFTRNSAA